MTPIRHWNVAGALVKPKGICTHSQNPKGPMVNAVRGQLVSVSSTCQYSDCKSRLVKMVAPSKQSKESSILGRLYASLIVLLLSFLRSIQNLRPPSFLQTRTTALAHGLADLANSSYLQHLLEMFLNFFVLMQGYPLIMFLKWHHIIQLDIMLNHRCLT